MFKNLEHKLIYALLTTGFLLLSFQSNAVTVLVETSVGDFQLELFEDVAPVTVENFISYINDNSYTDSFIHRKSAGFVIQGGQYTYTDNILGEVTAKPAIINEFRLSNTRGTIAMAKLGNNPDSATSSWFINLGDNLSLDTQNGGFTVFGEITGNGLDIVDAINSVQTYNAGSDFSELPLRDYPGIGTILAEHVIFTKFSVPASLNDFSDLQISKTVNIQNPAPGNSVDFQVRVTNAGPDSASGVVVSDLMPAGMQLPTGMSPFVSHGSYNLVTGIWTLGSLNTGTTATLTLPAQPRQYVSPECFVNEAKIMDLTEYDTAIANNKSIATVYVGGVSNCAKLTVIVTPTVFTQTACTATAADFLNFNVQIRNSGPDTATNVNLNLSGNLGGTAQPAQSGFTFSEIAPGETIRTTMSWALSCTRSAQVAAYDLTATSESTASTDSNMFVTGTFDISASSVATPSTPVAPTDSGGGGACFIATAAYGSYMDPHVYTLRKLRDNVLKKTYLGREFISLYYEYSPPLAAIISDNQFLRFLTRVLLTPVVYSVAYPLAAMLALIALIFTLLLKRKILSSR